MSESRRWRVETITSDTDTADMEKSTLLVTINPNVVECAEEATMLRDVIEYLTEKIDKVLFLKQGDVGYDYSELERILVGDIRVAVKYEIGTRYHRNHVHIKLEALLRGRGNKMQVKLGVLRGFLKEQFGYLPHVDVNAVKDSVFDVERYIRK